MDLFKLSASANSKQIASWFWWPESSCSFGHRNHRAAGLVPDSDESIRPELGLIIAGMSMLDDEGAEEASSSCAPEGERG